MKKTDFLCSEVKIKGKCNWFAVSLTDCKSVKYKKRNWYTLILKAKIQI